MAQLMPLPLIVSCFIKIQIGGTFPVPFTRVVPDKGPLNGCVCVCVCCYANDSNHCATAQASHAVCRWREWLHSMAFICALAASVTWAPASNIWNSQLNALSVISRCACYRLMSSSLFLFSSVACFMTECCRVDDTSPECAVTGLSPGWVDPDVDCLYIIISRPQPGSTWCVHKVSSNDWAVGTPPQWPDGDSVYLHFINYSLLTQEAEY